MRSAKGSSAKGHIRKNRGQSTPNFRQYRVTGTWPAPRPGAVYHAPDKPGARRIARAWAADGAVAVIEEARGFDWRLLETHYGPAIAAEREAAEQAAAEAARAAQDAADARVRAELAARAAQRRTDVREARDRAQTAALMQQPDIMRPAAQRRARHTAGGR